MIEVKNKTIGQRLVMTSKFPALQALGMGARLAKIMAPALSKALLGRENGGAEDILLADKKINMSALMDGLSTLARDLDAQAFEDLAKDVLRHTQVGWNGNTFNLGEKGEIDKAFEDDVEALYQCLAFVLQANNFFGLGGIGKLANLVPKAKQSTEPVAPKAA